MGASAEACATLTSRKIANPAGKTIAERDDSGRGEQYGKDLTMFAEPIWRGGEMAGPVISRTAVPAASTAPISEGPSPRS